VHYTHIRTWYSGGWTTFAASAADLDLLLLARVFGGERHLLDGHALARRVVVRFHDGAKRPIAKSAANVLRTLRQIILAQCNMGVGGHARILRHLVRVALLLPFARTSSIGPLGCYACYDRVSWAGVVINGHQEVHSDPNGRHQSGQQQLVRFRGFGTIFCSPESATFGTQNSNLSTMGGAYLGRSIRDNYMP
jgi:hypothetical protein